MSDETCSALDLDAIEKSIDHLCLAYGVTVTGRQALDALVAEVRALRAENARLTERCELQRLELSAGRWREKGIERRDERIARLRAALEKIAAEDEDIKWESADWVADSALLMLTVAKVALAGEEPT